MSDDDKLLNFMIAAYVVVFAFMSTVGFTVGYIGTGVTAGFVSLCWLAWLSARLFWR